MKKKPVRIVRKRRRKEARYGFRIVLPVGIDLQYVGRVKFVGQGESRHHGRALAAIFLVPRKDDGRLRELVQQARFVRVAAVIDEDDRQAVPAQGTQHPSHGAGVIEHGNHGDDLHGVAAGFFATKLQAEEALVELLRPLMTEGKVGGYEAVSRTAAFGLVQPTSPGYACWRESARP